MTTGIKGSDSGPCANHPDKRAVSKGLCGTCYKNKWWEENPTKKQKNYKQKLYGRYGLTPKDVEDMMENQKGLCAVCKRPLEKPVIDHNHETKVVRGLVHLQCNFMLGLAKDDPTVFLSAATYLINAHPLLNPAFLKDMKVVDKLWGSETWLTNTDLYCAKLLKIKPDHQCSLHHHKQKDETFILLQGIVYLELPTGVRIMRPGDKQRISPGMLHRFTGVTDALILEVSTMHEDSDSYRLENSRKIES